MIVRDNNKSFIFMCRFYVLVIVIYIKGILFLLLIVRFLLVLFILGRLGKLLIFKIRIFFNDN